jgi:dolichyl-diphosphooligosaccharide--protein glycosyltransferase
MSRITTGLLLAAFVLVGFAVRGLDVHDVFPGGGDVVFARDDAPYHVRRALYSFVNLPEVLFFDPYINYPEGSPVPWPPLYDLLLAVLARLFGDTLAVFERVVAWSSPLFGALTVLPVYAVARVLGGTGVGLGAAALAAVLPVAVSVARVGNPDHHAFVSLVGATWLVLCVGVLLRDTRGRRLWLLCAGLMLVRTVMVLSWSGSLFYVALADGCVLLLALLGNRRDLLLGLAAGSVGSALLVAPWVVVGGTPTGGAFSTITLSWFHIAVLMGIAAECAGLAALEFFWPSRSPVARVLRAGILAALALGLILLFPAPRQALVPATEFLTKTDSWGEGNLQARTLFGAPIPQVPRVPPEMFYGWFAYVLPLAALATLAWARKDAVREPAACVAVWVLLLGSMAVFSVRFGFDFAPYAAVAFALLLAELHQLLVNRLGRTRHVATGVVIAVGLLALWPPISRSYLRQLSLVRTYLSEADSTERRSLDRYQSLLHFGRIVREATPDTKGYLDRGRPAYGILCHESMGHAFRYASRRAVPADNFGPYLDRARFDSVQAFFTASSEAEGVEIARRLRTPYVVTDASHVAQRAQRAGLARVLHRFHGSARGNAPHLEHFRLITEGPDWGMTFFPMRQPVKVPYKLFELVEGAVFEVRADPGTLLSADVTVVTPLERRFLYRAKGRVGDDGVGRLRVPYATNTRAPAQPAGPYRVFVGERRMSVDVSDTQVREGSVIVLGEDVDGAS